MTDDPAAAQQARPCVTEPRFRSESYLYRGDEHGGMTRGGTLADSEVARRSQ